MNINDILTVKTSRGEEQWLIISEFQYWTSPMKYFLLENCEHGDEVPCIVMNSRCDVVEWNCYDSLEDWYNGLSN